MRIFDVDVDARDVAFALLTMPLVIVGLWAACSMLFAVGPR